MDIKTLESFKLSDAVKFHDDLNQKIFRGPRVQPIVKRQLLLIAQDFLNEMGIRDIEVEDITISGSNAAYSYTDHSDLDLHILVDMSKLENDEVYLELFNAKKNLYNDTHHIKIHGIPVELYIQDSNEPVVSLGEYSLLQDKWLRVPVKRRAAFNQQAAKAKYDKLYALIQYALKSRNLDRVTELLRTIKRYRQAGLDKGGEYSPENLVVKALRTQGYLTKLYALRDQLHSEELTIETVYQTPGSIGLREVFDTTPTRKNKAKWSGDEDITSLNFVASNGLPYQLSFTAPFIAPDEVSIYDFFPNIDDDIYDLGKFVEFSQGTGEWGTENKQGIEGTGVAAEVFGIIYNAILQYVKKYNPPYLIFQAAELSRRRLYTAMIKKMLQTMPNWKYGAKNGIFVAYNSKHLTTNS